MTKAIKTPALRFPEFKDEWIRTVIEEHFEFKNGLNKEKEFFGTGTPIINFVDVYKLNYIKQDDILGLVRLNESEINRYSAIKGDVFFTRTSETINDIGMSATLIEDIPNCVFSGFVLRARPKTSQFFPLFTSFLFNIQPVRKEIITKSSMTTRALTSGTLLNKVFLHYPSQKKEQQKIATFLTSVDERIQLLQKQKEALEQYKKGAMQKIFSRQLRFKDDNGKEYPDWVEKKLGEICEITTGKLDANAMVENGKYRFYTCAKDFFKIDKYAFDFEALLISGNGANVGYVHHYKGKFNAYQRTYVLYNLSENYLFIKNYLNQFLHERIHREKKDGNTPYIVLKTLSEMKIKLPYHGEQQKIASFLSAIDTQIEQVAHQIEQTQLFKKGLLQKMFV